MPEPTPFHDRLRRVRTAAAEAGLAAVAVVPGPNLRYLTGGRFHLSERPTILLMPVEGPSRMVVPTLELGKAQALARTPSLHPWSDDEGPEAATRDALAQLGLAGRRVGVEGRRIRWLELALLTDGTPAPEIVDADSVFAQLRMAKDKAELAHMRQAVRIAQEAWQRTLVAVRAGVSERDIAAELMVQLLRGGSGPLPFEPIVATGESGANPHAVPGERTLAAGDLVTVDWGATVEGYASDITRCVAVAGARVRPAMHEAYQAVRAANAAARAAARPGATGADVDRAARAVIEEAGLGPRFVHRTGHGLGLEAHEEPDIKAGQTMPLTVGMTFTIEPGVYLPGVGGCRVEDDMVITAEGSESLTTLSRELLTTDG